MMKKNEVFFNESVRKLCSRCGFPDGFCKHTIEQQYADCCPKTPLKDEDVWQLVRNHAIDKTEMNNLFNNFLPEMRTLREEVSSLKKQNQELTFFKKQIEEILLQNMMGKR